MFSRQQVARYVPIFRNIKRKHLCTKLIPYPTDIFFIFLRIIGTSTIYQDATRLEARPDVRNNSSLTTPANFYILQTPLAYRHRVFTEHPFTGAGHVRQYYVKEIFQRRKVRRFVIGDHNTGVPPFCQVLGKYLRTVANDFIGYQQTVFGKNAADMCRLTTRSCAKVKHYRRLLTPMLPQDLLHKHGRSFLHIIATRMKQRIESKRQAFFKIKTGSTPGNFILPKLKSKRLQRIQPDADRLLRLQSRRQSHIILISQKIAGIVCK